ncbi:N-acetyl-gamma-glutamyl-phosphate reductase [Thermopetrobacter sp. TC1]|uniref:N-acetyl-gamma-glutamyl-phosphate reductase n=1 Tax=Thermopetrobacter sp. TC1 TaxID=1495045 RepID=UPI00056DF579|nr:N-acetyl-gamma-glutamyl-phosphate reductase [Thermopetrobacter sp. TC1]
MTDKRIRVAIVGASGYTGADAIRLAARHPGIEIVALTANTHAGKPVAQVWPHLAGLDLPDLVTNEEVDWSRVDAAFVGLPHGTAQDVILSIPDHVRIIDISADFRLKDPQTYARWYGREHAAPELLAKAAYGLTEHNRESIRSARIVACPGCYPTATLLALLPLVKRGLIALEDLIIDAKSGVSGAGRGLKLNTLFCEAGEGLSPYGVASHRHAPEIEQELARAAGRDPASVVVNFTPHLVPMSRGELITAHVKLAEGATAADCVTALRESYAEEPFIRFAPEGMLPATQHVRGSNDCELAVRADRIPGRVIVIAAIDNLVKGSSGQALQNFNLMFGFPETTGLQQLPLFP